MRLNYVYTTYEGKKMGFLFEDMHLTEAHFFTCDKCETSAGVICTAVVEKIVPAIDGIFLRGPEQTSLFMGRKDAGKNPVILRRRGTKAGEELRVGDTVLVQIAAEAQKNKLAEATVNLSLSGEMVIVNRTGKIGVSKKIEGERKREELKQRLQELMKAEDPEGEYGLILRTAAAAATVEEILEETIEILCKLKELIRSGETTPEYKVLYRPQEQPEFKIRRLIRSGLYDTAAVYTDLEFQDELIRFGEEGERKTEVSAAAEKSTEDMSAGKAIPPQVEIHHVTEKESSLLVRFNIPVLLEKAMNRKVFLKDGGYLFIDRTEAMTVIDVNSGKSISGKDHEERAFAENKVAAEVIARQIRLRNLSGIILVDFISMKKDKNERELLEYLKQVTRMDPGQVVVVDMTRLGLVEMTRKKKDAPLQEILRPYSRNSGENME